MRTNQHRPPSAQASSKYVGSGELARDAERQRDDVDVGEFACAQQSTADCLRW